MRRPVRFGMPRLAALLLLAFAGACANGSAGGEGGSMEVMEATDAAVCAEGTLVVQALEVETVVYISPDEGEPVRVLLEDDPVFLGLSGAEVEVCGEMEPLGMRVDGYALISVDGYPAVLGTLVRRDAGWALEPADGGARVRLEAVPAALEEGAGQILWVSGRYTAASTAAEPVLRIVAWGTPAG